MDNAIPLTDLTPIIDTQNTAANAQKVNVNANTQKVNYTWTTTPKYPKFTDIEAIYGAQNVCAEWVNMYVICNVFLDDFMKKETVEKYKNKRSGSTAGSTTTMRKIVSFHPEDNKCSGISGMNHYLRFKTLGITSFDWQWYATVSRTYFHYLSTGNFNPSYTLMENKEEILETNEAERKTMFIIRPITQNWIRTADGSGVMTNSNIRGILNKFTLDETKINLFISIYSNNVSNNIICALNILQLTGWAIIALPNEISGDLMKLIGLFKEYFAESYLVNIANCPFLVGKKYKKKDKKIDIDLQTLENYDLTKEFKHIDKAFEYEVKCTKIDNRLLL